MTDAASERQRRRRRIQRLWANGRTQAEIARRLGLDSARVGAEVAKMRAAGVKLERRVVGDAQAMQRRRDRIAELWAAGASVTEIAAELGISPAAAYGTVKRMRRDGWELELRREPRAHAAPVRERIAELWAAGSTIPEIGAEMQRSTSHIASELSWMRREAGRDIELRHGNGSAAARRDHIAALYRDGQPLAVIATQMDSTVGSIATTLSSMRADGAELPRRAATPG